jgi:PAS domain S-box-containing protein
MIRMSGQERHTTAAALAEIADLPYFRVDADRNVVEMSSAMERLTGFAAEDAIGRSCLNIHRCEECLAGCGVFDEHTVLDKQLELYRADGSTVRVRKSGRVLLDDGGRIAGAIEVVRPLGDGSESDTTETARTTVEGPEPLGDAVAVEPGCEVTPAVEAAREEIEAIRAALLETRYRRVEAARLLGMSRTTLWRKMREYGL